MHLFTPRWQDGDRAQMALGAADYAEVMSRLRGSPWELAITDLVSGKKYLVRGADCSCPGCGCDAEIVREMASN